MSSYNPLLIIKKSGQLMVNDKGELTNRIVYNKRLIELPVDGISETENNCVPFQITEQGMWRFRLVNQYIIINDSKTKYQKLKTWLKNNLFK